MAVIVFESNVALFIMLEKVVKILKVQATAGKVATKVGL